MNSKKISCIIPVYNCEEYLEKVFEAIVHQVDEVIMVDDKSQDGSYELAKKITRKFKHKTKLYKLDKNKGCGFAKNYGAKKSKYELLLFLDSDQVCEKEWVKKGLKELKNNVGIIGGLRPSPKKNFPQKLMHVIRMKDILKKKVKFVDAAVIVPKAVFLKAGMFESKMRRGGIQKLNSYFEKKGLEKKCTNMNSLHLGTPTSFLKILKRQWKYGTEEPLLSKVSLKSIFIEIIYILPISILFSYILYKYIILKEIRLIKDLKLMILLPFAYYLFLCIHGIGYIRTVIKRLIFRTNK